MPDEYVVIARLGLAWGMDVSAHGLKDGVLVEAHEGNRGGSHTHIDAQEGEVDNGR